MCVALRADVLMYCSDDFTNAFVRRSNNLKGCLEKRINSDSDGLQSAKKDCVQRID